MSDKSDNIGRGDWEDEISIESRVMNNLRYPDDTMLMNSSKLEKGHKTYQRICRLSMDRSTNKGNCNKRKQKRKSEKKKFVV